MKKTERCVSCGIEFECETDELHEAGFPHRPDGAASINISIQCQLPNVEGSSFPVGPSGYGFWHTICLDCGRKFHEATYDPLVLRALVDLLGWYVRQGIDLKTSVDSIRKTLGSGLAPKR